MISIVSKMWRSAWAPFPCPYTYVRLEGFGVVEVRWVVANNWQGLPGKLFNQHCLNCGDTESSEDVAVWYSTATWWKPWTWRDGFFELRYDRLGRIEAERLGL